MSTKPTVEVERLARQLKSLYVQKARQSNPKFKIRTGQATDNDFNRAAKKCLEGGWDPAQYMDAAFAVCKVRDYPFTNNLYRDQIVEFLESEKQHRNYILVRKDENGNRVEKSVSRATYMVAYGLNEIQVLLMKKFESQTLTPEAEETLLSPIYGLDPVLVCVLGAGSERILREKGPRAREILTQDMGLRNSLIELGYAPHIEVIEHGG